MAEQKNKNILEASNSELFDKTDELIDIFVKAFKDLEARILNVGRMREAINLAFMEMAKRECLKEYSESRKELMGKVLSNLVDSEDAKNLEKIVKARTNGEESNILRDSKKSKFFVEK